MDENIEIDVSIAPNFFAPKCADRDLNFDIRNSHAIVTSRCNFQCSFCKHGISGEKSNYMTFSNYESIIKELMNQGKMFKFTGGEPCMNPYIKEMVEVVKNNGGIVFLDTNGSMTNVVTSLLKNRLIDVLGVSLKGLTSKEALKTSNTINPLLCWRNVLNTIETATKYENVRVIVTYVAYNDFKYSDLCKFSKILDKFGDNIYLKINNLCGKEHRDQNLKTLDAEILPKMIVEFIKKNPKWKNRTILVNSSDGVSNYSKIIFS